jgi:hypothetical protein
MGLVATCDSDKALDENIGSAALRRTKMHHRHPHLIHKVAALQPKFVARAACVIARVT